MSLIYVRLQFTLRMGHNHIRIDRAQSRGTLGTERCTARPLRGKSVIKKMKPCVFYFHLGVILKCETLYTFRMNHRSRNDPTLKRHLLFLRQNRYKMVNQGGWNFSGID